jgi:hypothetical protein
LIGTAPTDEVSGNEYLLKLTIVAIPYDLNCAESRDNKRCLSVENLLSPGPELFLSPFYVEKNYDAEPEQKKRTCTAKEARVEERDLL